jgi:tRNA (guanine-N7-)-methyltransferase
VHGPGVGSLLNRIEAEQLANLRVIRHDAVDVLEHMVADGSLVAIHLFFPDPWPKKRHHKRRLVQGPFAALAARKLAPGGVLHAATDWPDYAERMQQIFGAESSLQAASRGLFEKPPTKFEVRGRRLGHPIRELFYRRAR